MIIVLKIQFEKCFIFRYLAILVSFLVYAHRRASERLSLQHFFSSLPRFVDCSRRDNEIVNGIGKRDISSFTFVVGKFMRLKLLLINFTEKFRQARGRCVLEEQNCAFPEMKPSKHYTYRTKNSTINNNLQDSPILSLSFSKCIQFSKISTYLIFISTHNTFCSYILMNHQTFLKVRVSNFFLRAFIQKEEVKKTSKIENEVLWVFDF